MTGNRAPAIRIRIAGKRCSFANHVLGSFVFGSRALLQICLSECPDPKMDFLKAPILKLYASTRCFGIGMQAGVVDVTVIDRESPLASSDASL